MHIFSSCKTALLQGRYSWRHDSVLKCPEPVLVKHIKEHNDKKLPKTKSNFIKFVKKGSKGGGTSTQPIPKHLLTTAQDWQCQIDYKENSTVFPAAICITSPGGCFLQKGT
jgi:hypothetical protein